MGCVVDSSGGSANRSLVEIDASNFFSDPMYCVDIDRAGCNSPESSPNLGIEEMIDTIQSSYCDFI